MTLLSEERQKQIIAGMQIVMDNNGYGEREARLLLYGVIAALGEENLPHWWLIAALSGRPIVNVHPQPPAHYTEPGTYALAALNRRGGYFVEVEEGYDAREVALEKLGYILTRSPLEEIEIEELDNEGDYY